MSAFVYLTWLGPLSSASTMPLQYSRLCLSASAPPWCALIASAFSMALQRGSLLCGAPARLHHLTLSDAPFTPAQLYLLSLRALGPPTSAFERLMCLLLAHRAFYLPPQCHLLGARAFEPPQL